VRSWELFAACQLIDTNVTNRPFARRRGRVGTCVGRRPTKSKRIRLSGFEIVGGTSLFRLARSEDARSRFDNLLRAGIADEKIIVNPNGVDTEGFQPGVGGDDARREFGIAGHETVAGFVGTFGPWHGVLTLARAIACMPDDPKVRFLLIGAGRFRDEVEQIIRDAGKERQVIFAGHVDHRRVPALLDACDILLSPHVPLEDGSDFFGSPTKLFEYMAMGKGIVASRLGQIGDVLVDEETALLVEPGNVSELTNAILRLASSGELRASLGAAARAAAVERHTWKQNAQRVIGQYFELS